MKVRRNSMVLAISLGMMLNPLNSSMIAVAIPSLQQAFGLSLTAVVWIVFAFYISGAIAQPIVGKSSDLIGRRRLFLLGLVIALVASLAAPFAPNFGTLVTMRIAQAIGTGMTSTVGLALIRFHVSDRREQALSMISSFQSGAAALGPFIGGVLIHWWGWSSIFYVNLPVMLVSLVMAWKLLPVEAPVQRTPMSVRNWLIQIDGNGVLLFAAGLIILLGSLLSGKSSAHWSMLHIIGTMGGLLLLIALVRHEWKVDQPFIPLRTFAEFPALSWINGGFMIANILFYALFFGYPSYLQQVVQLDSLHTGIIMLTLGLASVVGAALAGHGVRRYSSRVMLWLAAVLMFVGAGLLLTVQLQSPLWLSCGILLLFGLGSGLSNVAMQTDLMQETPESVVGVVSGLFNMARNFGGILASTLISIMAGSAFTADNFHELTMVLIGLAVVYGAVLYGRQRMSNSARNRQGQHKSK
ncbi:MFS transporter [Paenibacillus sp. WLX2291]|uniref:MFS transporter n=1 Tax=Paenibacillus sp. WLX2291 TaxID=3296934 RepID=UPI0039842098